MHSFLQNFMSLFLGDFGFHFISFHLGTSRKPFITSDGRMRIILFLGDFGFYSISAHFGISLQNITFKATDPINAKQNKIKSVQIISMGKYFNCTNLGTTKSNSYNVKPAKSQVSLVAEANGLIHLHPYQNSMSYYFSAI